MRAEGSGEIKEKTVGLPFLRPLIYLLYTCARAVVFLPDIHGFRMGRRGCFPYGSNKINQNSINFLGNSLQLNIFSFHSSVFQILFLGSVRLFIGSLGSVTVYASHA